MNIKRLFLSAICLMAICGTSFAAPVFNAPAIRIQPNGDTVRCLLSGDEFYHRLHDAAGYTIVQNPRTGYWVYADTVHSDATHWDIVATNYIVGSVNPASVGLNPNAGVDRETWNALQHRYDVPKGYEQTNAAKTSGRNHGTMNNIVIYIRFSDESEISTPLSDIDAMFNDSTANATSMYNYFKHASYNKLFIRTYYYPTPNGNNVVSYQDSLPRNYYKPYDATTNPTGYQDDTERRIREFSLLERAVNYVNTYYPIPSSLNIDMDNDGYVDNICFVVKGTYTGWSDLLWPHKWSIYDRYVYINGKRVYTFNLQLEGSGTHYFSSSTFCHEMFHTLGAPDLYRYNNYTDVSGVGSWDLMCSNTTPPQHMSAYMKWKYGNWLDSIPEIIIPGTYTLHSLADDDYSNCAYKIAAQEPHQWYVLEYRDNTELFETALPGKGLLIFRIDDRYNGNAGFDRETTFDEVYLFRPGAHNDTTNGTLAQAYFSGNTNRTQFTPSTNPHPWLTGNVIDTTFSITGVTSPGATISFTYNDLRGCRIPSNMSTENVTGVSADLSWSGISSSYVIQWRDMDSYNISSDAVSGSSYTISGLNLDTRYEWRVRGVCEAGDSSSYTSWMPFKTAQCVAPQYATIAASDTTNYIVPFNNYYNYSYVQMIYTADEIGGPTEVTSISFNYQSSTPTTAKDSCTIYMGHTTKTVFESSQISSLVPISDLQKVYEGPIYCEHGWNEILLDSNFSYNGTSNLVIAIDDNSGAYDGSSYKFYCTRSSDNSYQSMIFYSDNHHYVPGSSSYSGSKGRRRFKADIRLTGCEAAMTYSYTVTVSSADSTQGTVTGSGIYDENSEVTISATPTTGFEFDYWMCGSSQISTNPYTFTVTGDTSFTAYFKPIMHHISVSGDTWGNAYINDGTNQTSEGDYPYGTVLNLVAEPHTEIPNTVCTFVSWSDGITDNPRTITLMSDTAFIAVFHGETVGIGDAENAEIAITAWQHTLTVSGASDKEITVFDIAGRVLYNAVGKETNTFLLPHVGVYIVRVEGFTPRKVVIR